MTAKPSHTHLPTLYESQTPPIAPLGRHRGDKTGVSGQWLIVGSPDVGDGFELNPAGIFRVPFGGGLRFYF